MRALILDCDGVIAETERAIHLPAFNRAFEEFGLDVRWSEDGYGEQLRIGGGRERIANALGEGSEELAARVHRRKGAIVDELLASSHLEARPGVVRLVSEAHDAGWRLAVASTSAESTVRAVLGHVLEPVLAARFLVLAGDVVPAKKPDPAIYELALERLGARSDEAVVVEDSRNGLLAATAARIRVIVTVSDYSENENVDEAVLVVSHLGSTGFPATVIADRAGIDPGAAITLHDLEAVLRAPVPRPTGILET